MSAQRLVQKGWYFASAGLPQTGHLAWMRTARKGADRSGGAIAHKNCAMPGARQHIFGAARRISGGAVLKKSRLRA
jgi:hypothetical protein